MACIDPKGRRRAAGGGGRSGSVFSVPSVPRTGDRDLRAFLEAVKDALEGYEVAGPGADTVPAGRSSFSFAHNAPGAGVEVRTGHADGIISFLYPQNDIPYPSLLLIQWRDPNTESLSEFDSSRQVAVEPGRTYDFVGAPCSEYEFRFSERVVIPELGLEMDSGWSRPSAYTSIPVRIAAPAIDIGLLEEASSGNGYIRFSDIGDRPPGRSVLSVQAWPLNGNYIDSFEADGRPGHFEPPVINYGFWDDKGHLRIRWRETPPGCGEGYWTPDSLLIRAPYPMFLTPSSRGFDVHWTPPPPLKRTNDRGEVAPVEASGIDIAVIYAGPSTTDPNSRVFPTVMTRGVVNDDGFTSSRYRRELPPASRLLTNVRGRATLGSLPAGELIWVLARSRYPITYDDLASEYSPISVEPREAYVAGSDVVSPWLASAIGVVPPLAATPRLFKTSSSSLWALGIDLQGESPPFQAFGVYIGARDSEGAYRLSGSFTIPAVYSSQNSQTRPVGAIAYPPGRTIQIRYRYRYGLDPPLPSGGNRNDSRIFSVNNYIVAGGDVSSDFSAASGVWSQYTIGVKIPFPIPVSPTGSRLRDNGPVNVDFRYVDPVTGDTRVSYTTRRDSLISEFTERQTRITPMENDEGQTTNLSEYRFRWRYKRLLVGAFYFNVTSDGTDAGISYGNGETSSVPGFRPPAEALYLRRRFYLWIVGFNKLTVTISGTPSGAEPDMSGTFDITPSSLLRDRTNPRLLGAFSNPYSTSGIFPYRIERLSSWSEWTDWQESYTPPANPDSPASGARFSASAIAVYDSGSSSASAPVLERAPDRVVHSLADV